MPRSTAQLGDVPGGLDVASRHPGGVPSSPTQLLALLFQSVQRGELTKKDAEQRLGHVRALRIRLLGDRVLQRVAWTGSPTGSGGRTRSTRSTSR